MMRTKTTRRKRSSEEGYTLLFVMFMLAVLTIWLSVAVPKVAKEIQRDHEVETMHRGKQYVRAVQLYYRKFHAYPPNADALNNTNEIRFLRKKYIDPTTGKDDWKPIRFGQNKTQTLGFFGQPLAGSTTALAGIGPSGNGGLGGTPMGIGASPTGNGGGSGFGGSSIFSSTDGSGNNPASGTTPSPGSAGTGTTGLTGTSTGTSNGSSSSSSIFSDSGSGNQTFGGAGIIGFSPASTKTSILIYKKKQHYNEWEFFYDPLSDMRTIAGNTGGVGQPISNTSNPVGGPSPTPGSGFSSGFGSGSGSESGSGGGAGSGGGPGTATPTPTPQPQQ